MRHLDICAVVQPFNHVVNSVVIGRVKKRDDDIDSNSFGKLSLRDRQGEAMVLACW